MITKTNWQRSFRCHLTYTRPLKQMYYWNSPGSFRTHDLNFRTLSGKSWTWQFLIWRFPAGFRNHLEVWSSRSGFMIDALIAWLWHLTLHITLRYACLLLLTNTILFPCYPPYLPQVDAGDARSIRWVDRTLTCRSHDHVSNGKSTFFGLGTYLSLVYVFQTCVSSSNCPLPRDPSDRKELSK